MIKTNPILTLLSAAIILCGSTAAVAGGVNSNAGTSAFPFLKINIGARAVCIGGDFTGLADYESALYYSPAGTSAFDLNRSIACTMNYL